MITKPDAELAIASGTMCYAVDGQSVTLVKIKEGNRSGVEPAPGARWIVLTEYGDGSRKWAQPADIWLSTDL